jgi:hypothetical protein
VTSNVLKQAPTGPGILNDAANLRPEVAVIVRALSLPGNAERLARVAGGEESDGSGKRSGVIGP